MDADGLEKLIGRFYTAFVLRDLTFFASGGLVIASVLPTPVDTIAGTLTRNISFQWLGLPAFLALSYVLGVLLQELVRVPLEPLSSWWIKKKRKRSEPPGRLVVRMEEVYRKRSLHTALGVERVLFLKQVAATQSSALFLLALLRFAGGNLAMPLPWWVFLLISLAWSAMYVDKSLQEDDILVGLEQLTEDDTVNSRGDR